MAPNEKLPQIACGKLLVRLMESVDDLFFVIGEDGRYLLFGERGLRRYGFQDLKVLGKTPVEAFGPEAGGRFQRHNEEVFRTGKPQRLQEWIDLDGTPRCFDTSIIPINDESGKTLAVLGMGREISEQKRVQEEREFYFQQLELHSRQRLSYEELVRDIIREAAARRSLREFFQATVDALGQKLQVSRADLYEYDSVREIVSKAAEWTAEGVAPTKAEMQEYSALGQPWWRAELLAGRPVCVEDTEQAPQPEVRDILRRSGVKATIAVPIFAFGKAFGFVDLDDCARPRRWEPAEIDLLSSVARVIAQRIERQRLEDDILNTARLAAIGRLTASFAHEINNPLQSVLLNLEMLQGHVDAAGERHLDRVSEGFRLVSGIVGRLAHANRGVSAPAELEVNELVARAYRLLAHQFDQKGITIIWRLDPERPAVRGEGEKLHQLWLNLLFNACEAMDKGGELIIATRTAGEMAVVQIRDSGCGIEEARLPYIFDPFFTSKEEGGVGLGLYVAHRIVTEHGGRIHVESEKGKGTSVTVELPSRGK